MDECHVFSIRAYQLSWKAENLCLTRYPTTHKQTPLQPEQEKAMDLANNRRGQSIGEKLVSQHKKVEEEIMKSFEEDLASGRLIVLKKGR